MIDWHLKKDVQLAENCILHAYRDSLGVITIGWGHALRDQSDAQLYLTWTQQEADDQLDTDLIAAEAFAQTLSEWPQLDTACRQNSVIELCFNLGSRWLTFVETRKAIRLQNWQAAHDGLLNSLWARQVHAARANRIATYLLVGEYP